MSEKKAAPLLVLMSIKVLTSAARAPACWGHTVAYTEQPLRILTREVQVVCAG